MKTEKDIHAGGQYIKDPETGRIVPVGEAKKSKKTSPDKEKK